MVTKIAAEMLKQYKYLGPDSWIKQYFSYNDISDSSPKYDDSATGATCWCMYGMFHKVGGSQREWDNFNIVCDRITGSSVIRFNDLPTTTYDSVINFLERVANG